MPLSPEMQEAINAPETGEVIIPLTKLTHPDWDDPVLLAANTEPVTHLGEEYLPFAFTVNPPDQEEDIVPVMQWAADNVDRRLIPLLRGVTGAVDAQVTWVLASDPDHVQIGPYEAQMRGVEYDATMLSGTLAVDPVEDLQFGHMEFVPANFPGLF